MYAIQLSQSKDPYILANKEKKSLKIMQTPIKTSVFFVFFCNS